MFKRIQSNAKPINLRFEDRDITAQDGDSVAAALLAAGITVFREAADCDDPRGPYCMIGNCYECLVEIDGEANRQACQVRVREGMQIQRQRGQRKLESANES